MAYTRLDLALAVQDDLKDSSFSLTRINRYLTAAQNAIFNTHMFKFCEKLYSGTLTLSATSVTQQTDHQATIGAVLIDPVTTTRIALLNADNLMPSRDFFDMYPNAAGATAGLPSVWTEYGNAIYFNCPLDKAYTFKQRYYRMATEMTGDTDVPDVPAAFRELLENYALAKAEKYRGNHDIAGTYKQDFEDGLETMVLRYAEGTQVGPVQQGSNRVRVSEDA